MFKNENVGDLTTQRDIPEKSRCFNCRVPESIFETLFQKEGAKKGDPLYCERCLLKMEEDKCPYPISGDKTAGDCIQYEKEKKNESRT